MNRLELDRFKVEEVGDGRVENFPPKCGQNMVFIRAMRIGG